MAIWWLEAHDKKNNRQEAPTKEQLEELDCLKDLDLFETMCKILNIPMEVKKIWAKRRLMPGFGANMTAWLYEYAKNIHITKQSIVYSSYQVYKGSEAFERAFVTHQEAVTTTVKRTSNRKRMIDCDGREKEVSWRKVWREMWRCASATASGEIGKLMQTLYLVTNKG